MEQVRPDAPRWQRWAHAIAYAPWFDWVIMLVIVANAVTIAVGTYTIPTDVRVWTERLDAVFLGVFVMEMVLKLAAYGFHVKRFFANGWNTFDFIVIFASFIPGLAQDATALRLVRVARVTRLMRVMPDFPVLLSGLRRAAAPAFSLLALTTLLCYLYAVIGWMMFHDRIPPEKPQYFANIGESMLTLFELLTLEGWNTVLHDLRDAHPWALVYVISFLLIGTYVVINLVIGVVITSLDDAYKQRDREQRARDVGAADLERTVAELRDLVERLEGQVASQPKEAHGSRVAPE